MSRRVVPSRALSLTLVTPQKRYGHIAASRLRICGRGLAGTEAVDTIRDMSWGRSSFSWRSGTGSRGFRVPGFGHAAFYIDLLAERGVLLSAPHTKQFGSSC
jgi:hypothetical protein